MNYIIPLIFIFGFFLALLYVVWHIFKYPSVFQGVEQRSNIGRVFIGSLFGVILGIFFLYGRLDWTSMGNDRFLGSLFLFVSGFFLSNYSVKLIKKSNYGEVEKLLGFSYSILAFILLLLALFLLII